MVDLKPTGQTKRAAVFNLLFGQGFYNWNYYEVKCSGCGFQQWIAAGQEATLCVNCSERTAEQPDRG